MLRDYWTKVRLEPDVPFTHQAVTWVDRDGIMYLKDGFNRTATLNNKCTNFLRNSTFAFNQRWDPAGKETTFTFAGIRGWVADGWAVSMGTDGATLNYSREVDTDLVNFGRFQNTSGDVAKFCITQSIEPELVRTLRGKTVRFHFTIRASEANSIEVGLLKNTTPTTGIYAEPLSATSEDWDAEVAPLINGWEIIPHDSLESLRGLPNEDTELKADVTTEWQTMAAVFTIAEDAECLMLYYWTTAEFTDDAYLDLKNVFFTLGSDVPVYEFNYEVELRKCQRFYRKSMVPDIYEDFDGVNIKGIHIITCKATTTDPDTFTDGINVNLGIVMARRPDIRTFNPYDFTEETWAVIQGTGDPGTQYVLTAATGQNSFYIRCTFPTETPVGTQYGIHWVADAEL